MSKVAFFSTSNRSISVLETVAKEHQIVFCVTKPDVKVGRDQHIQKNLIKEWAQKNEIPCIAIENLKNQNLEIVIEQIKSSNPNIGLVIDFGFIVPSQILELFTNNLINIHFSLLPKYRGSSPGQFALINGDKKTGITFQTVSKKYDCGDILDQIEYTVTPKETADTLYKNLFDLTASNILNFLQKCEKNELNPLPQNELEGSYTYSKTFPTKTFTFKEDAQINWDESGEVIERKIRAYNSWPIAWTFVKDLETYLETLGKNMKFKPTVNKKLKIKIYEADVVNGKLQIEKLQLEGKAIINWKDFENGYLFATADALEGII